MIALPLLIQRSGACYESSRRAKRLHNLVSTTSAPMETKTEEQGVG